MKQTPWQIDAVADLQRQRAGGADRMADQLVGAGVVDLDRHTVGDDRAGALEHGPDPAGLVRAAVGTGHVVGLRDQQHAGLVLGPDRRQRLDVDAEQLGDRAFGLVVGALAEVVLEQQPVLVEQIAGRPAEVVVVGERLQLGVDQHRVLDPESLHGRGDVVGVGRWGKAGGVHTDHLQALVAVALVPCPQVGEGADRVGPTEVPELDQHGPAALLVHSQRLDVQPARLGWERRARRCDRPGRARRSMVIGRLPGAFHEESGSIEGAAVTPEGGCGSLH